MRDLWNRLFRLTPYRIAILVGLAFTVLHLRIATGGTPESTPLIGRIETIFHDLKFHERGVRKPSGDVVVAAVDEKAIATLGRWPFARTDVGALIDKLTALGARAIVFDVAYTDAAYEGQSAVARKLHARFQDVSLAGAPGSELVSQLELARTDAAGAVSAARAIEGQASAARDVKARMEPVARSIDTVLRAVERYRNMQEEYGRALALELDAADTDEALAAAVHRSGRVVLGSFLLTPSEVEQLSADAAGSEVERLSHAFLNPPTIDPELRADEEIFSERPLPGVAFHTFPAARAPMDILMRQSQDAPGTVAVAFFNTVPDPDGVIRRAPLVLGIGDPSGMERLHLVPGLDLGGVLRYFDADPRTTRLWGATDDPKQFETVAFLPGDRVPAEGSPRYGDFIRIPVDNRGRLLLNYYGPDGTFPNVSVGDIWNGAVPRERIEGKIVLFGVTATGTFDQRVTPFDPISPGVEIHATAMENILHDDYLYRPWWALAFECGILLAIALLVGALLARVRVLVGLPVMIATMGAYHLFDHALFRMGISVFSALPLFEVSSIYVLQTLFRYSTEEREKRQIRRAFQFYLTRSVMDEMLKDPAKLKLGGEKKVLSILFSDIRGFTGISEKLQPEQLAKLINEYLTPMTNIVFEHGGTLDKYIGDALMAIYGAPVDQPDHALRCCRTAVAMGRELQKLQERWRMEGENYPPLEIGIGINSGPVVVGNMGSNVRFDYTVLGDNVNLASRLEGITKTYAARTAISQSTLDLCRDAQGKLLLAARELGAVRVKGRQEPVRIYELLDDKPATGEVAEVIRRFEAGVACFRRQEWEAARTHFRAVLKLWPSDGPSKAYLDFCDDYEAAPPGANWDGVYVATQK